MHYSFNCYELNESFSKPGSNQFCCFQFKQVEQMMHEIILQQNMHAFSVFTKSKWIMKWKKRKIEPEKKKELVISYLKPDIKWYIKMWHCIAMFMFEMTDVSWKMPYEQHRKIAQWWNNFRSAFLLFHQTYYFYLFLLKMFSRKYLPGSFLKDKHIKYLSSAAKSVFKTNILHKAPKS